DALALSEPLASYVVRPLRSARRWLKLNPVAEEMAVVDPTIASLHQHLYEQIKTLELQAEQLQEKMLEALLLVAEQSLASQLPSRDNQVMDAVHNHQILLEASAVPLNDEID